MENVLRPALRLLTQDVARAVRCSLAKEVDSNVLYRLSATEPYNGGPDGTRTRDLLRDRQAC